MKILSIVLLLYNLFPLISANKEVQGNLVDCPEPTGKFANEEDPNCSIYFHCKDGKGFEGRHNFLRKIIQSVLSRAFFRTMSAWKGV